MHMFAGAYRRQISLLGYLNGGMVETAQIKNRHDALVHEMERRGYSHFSPLEKNPTEQVLGQVDVQGNLEELARRCPRCALLQKESSDV